MVTEELSRGDRLELNSQQTYPLEMSPRGGVESGRLLEVQAGTEVVVAKDCGPDDFEVLIHFVEEPLRKQGGGQPFFASRCFLNRKSACPIGGGCC